MLTLILRAAFMITHKINIQNLAYYIVSEQFEYMSFEYIASA
jgi:hypothetical protein